MGNLNLCQFIGNVGKIETRYLADGKACTNLSLAVNESYKNKDGDKVENTEWVRVSMFGKLAEIAEKYVQKGAPLYVSGKMKTRKYTDKDGQDRYTTEIIADQMQMLGSRSTEESSVVPQSRPAPAQQAAPSARMPAATFGDMDDSIPF